MLIYGKGRDIFNILQQHKIKTNEEEICMQAKITNNKKGREERGSILHSIHLAYQQLSFSK